MVPIFVFSTASLVHGARKIEAPNEKRECLGIPFSIGPTGTLVTYLESFVGFTRVARRVYLVEPSNHPKSAAVKHFLVFINFW